MTDEIKKEEQTKEEVKELEGVDEAKVFTEKLEKCEKDKEEYLNGWKRAKADLINYQKEEAKRLEELLKFGNIDLIRDFIPVLDSFDLALTVLEKEGKAEKGIYMIRAQLEDVLKKRGFERMTVAVGNPFDPNLHESVGEIESGEPAGTIAMEVERGYLLNGRVVRPARVKLAKTKSQ